MTEAVWLKDTIIEASQIVSYTLSPEPVFRFKAGRLQQAWRNIDSRGIHWQDVPAVDADAPDVE